MVRLTLVFGCGAGKQGRWLVGRGGGVQGGGGGGGVGGKWSGEGIEVVVTGVQESGEEKEEGKDGVC